MLKNFWLASKFVFRRIQVRYVAKVFAFGTVASAKSADCGKKPIDGKIKIPEIKDCMKTACLLNVNAASSLLTTTIFSIDRLVNNYKETMTTLTGLLEECVLLDGWNDELWDSVIAHRTKGSEQKLELEKLIAHFEIVKKVVNASIEAAFSIDANYLCTTLCEHSHAAEEKMKDLEKVIKNLDEQYLVALTNVVKFKKSVD